MTARLVIVWIWILEWKRERKTLQAKRATREEPSKCRFLIRCREKKLSFLETVTSNINHTLSAFKVQKGGTLLYFRDTLLLGKRNILHDNITKWLCGQWNHPFKSPFFSLNLLSLANMFHVLGEI